jgi:hypothetical protein
MKNKIILILFSHLLIFTVSHSQTRRLSYHINNTNSKQEAVLKRLIDSENPDKDMYDFLGVELIKKFDQKQLKELKSQAFKDTVVVNLLMYVSTKGKVTYAALKDWNNNKLFPEIDMVKASSPYTYKAKKAFKKNKKSFIISYDFLFTLKGEEQLKLSPIPFETQYNIPRNYLIGNNKERINLVFKACSDSSDVIKCFYKTVQDSIFVRLQEVKKQTLTNYALDDILAINIHIYTNKNDTSSNSLKYISSPKLLNEIKYNQDSIFQGLDFKHLRDHKFSGVPYFSSNFFIFFKLNSTDTDQLDVQKLPLEYRHRYRSNKQKTFSDNPVTHPDCVEIKNIKEQYNCLNKKVRSFVNRKYPIPQKKPYDPETKERMSILLKVNEKGIVEVLSIHGGKDVSLINNAIQTVKKLPKMIPAKDSLNNPKESFIQLPFYLNVQ